MTETSRQRPPIDVIVFLVVGLVYGRMLVNQLLAPMLNNGSPQLWPGVHLQAIVIDLLTMVVFAALVIIRKLWAPEAAKQRFVVYSVWAGLIILGVMIGHSIVRQASHSTRITHDGVIQSDVAARFILRGVNPYAVDYRGTALDGAAFTNVPDDQSLFTHYVYPPLVPLVTIPIVWFADLAHTYVELQYVFVVVMAAAVGVLLWLVPGWDRKTLLLLATLGNPLFTLYPAAGYNDMLMFGLLVLAAALFARRKWAWSGALFGLALAAKQTAWFYLPLWAVLVWTTWRGGSADERRGLLRHVGWTALVALVLYAPFVINNPSATFDDLVRFPGGTIPGSYPIGGSTIWQYRVLLDRAHYYWLTVPSQLVEAVLGLMFYALIAWRYRQTLRVGMWLLLSSAIILVIGIVNRYNYDNYFSALAFTCVCGWVLDRYVEKETA